jgi:hypothetical protein
LDYTEYKFSVLPTALEGALDQWVNSWVWLKLEH